MYFASPGKLAEEAALTHSASFRSSRTQPIPGYGVDDLSGIEVGGLPRQIGDEDASNSAIATSPEPMTNSSWVLLPSPKTSPAIFKL